MERVKPLSVSVIIPVLNEEKTIGSLIETLQSDPCPKEIIVVDGGSTDRTKKIAEEKGAKVIQESGDKCPANARNQGAKHANGRILCFLDGDVEKVGEGFISNAVKHFRNKNVVGVKCKGEIIEDSLVEKIISCVRELWTTKLFDSGKRAEFHANFIRRAVFEQLGGFPLLGFGEDRAFWRKFGEYLERNPKKKVVLEPKSVFYYHRSHSFREYFKQLSWYGRTSLLYLRSEESKASLRELVEIAAKGFWPISLVSLILVVISPWFLVLAAPFVIRLFISIFEALRRKSKLFLSIPVLDVVGGVGFLYGLARYLVGERWMSRG